MKKYRRRFSNLTFIRTMGGMKGCSLRGSGSAFDNRRECACLERSNSRGKFIQVLDGKDLSDVEDPSLNVPGRLYLEVLDDLGDEVALYELKRVR